jgi:sulfur carrier protein
MRVWLNGEPAEIKGLTNVAELAAQYGLQPNTVLIEHNAMALHQREWVESLLAEGDRIEFVRVVAGG